MHGVIVIGNSHRFLIQVCLARYMIVGVYHREEPTGFRTWFVYRGETVLRIAAERSLIQHGLSKTIHKSHLSSKEDETGSVSLSAELAGGGLGSMLVISLRLFCSRKAKFSVHQTFHTYTVRLYKKLYLDDN